VGSSQTTTKDNAYLVSTKKEEGCGAKRMGTWRENTKEGENSISTRSARRGGRNLQGCRFSVGKSTGVRLLNLVVATDNVGEKEKREDLRTWSSHQKTRENDQ